MKMIEGIIYLMDVTHNLILIASYYIYSKLLLLLFSNDAPEETKSLNGYSNEP